MGITWQPDFQSYWNVQGTDGAMFGRPFVQRVMGRDRFIEIFRCLHFTNVVGLTQEQRTERSRHNSFWMVAEFLSFLATNCMYYIIVGKFLSIDEMCIWFKGRHRSRCYNPVILDLINEGQNVSRKRAVAPDEPLSPGGDVQFLAVRRKAIATRKEEEDLRLSGERGHTPGIGGQQSVDATGKKTTDARRRCKCCQTKTTYKCIECDQFLCLFNGTGEHNCWWRFHHIKGEDMLKLTPVEEEKKSAKTKSNSAKSK